MTPLTPEQQAFAEAHHGLILDFMEKHSLDGDYYGLLAQRYLKVVVRYLTEEKLAGIRELDCIAKERNQTLAQMALAWILRRPEVTSVLIGASSCGQLEDNVAALKNTVFGQEELARIEQVLAGIGRNS